MFRKFHHRRVRACAVYFIWFLTLSLVPGPVAASVPADELLPMPDPGVMVHRSTSYAPAMMNGVTIHPDRPFHFDFVIDKGESASQDESFRNESMRLVRYFLASLTVPEQDLWVNLSPEEADRTIPPEFAQTDMGRDLLLQDYLLKQFTASLMYPDKETGQDFWRRVHRRAQQLFGTTDVPVNTFNKVWIVPQAAVVYQNGNSAYVVESTLKVMMEEDYQAAAAGQPSPPLPADRFADEIVRDVLIPEIEYEVNHGKQFARLRQIYHTLILATWYKENIRASFVNEMYSNRNKIAGIDISDKDSKEEIYAAYLAAFRRGVYNMIREDYDPYSRRMIPRNYFSGGMNIKPVVTVTESAAALPQGGDMALLAVKLDPMNNGRIVNVAEAAGDQALLSEQLDPDERRRYIRSLINRRVTRPEPEELEGIGPREIALAARGLAAPVNPIRDYTRLHELALPLLKAKLNAVLRRHAAEQPTYVVLARDGDMLYDMLRLMDPNAAAQGRIKLINISLRQSERIVDPGSPFFDAEQAASMRAFLRQEGVGTDDLQSGKFVFIDSAYKGSIFDTILRLNNLKPEDVSGRVTGYLVFRDDARSAYTEMPDISPNEAMDALTGLAAVFDRSLQDLMPGFVKEQWASLSLQRRLNFMLALYLQVQPKFLRNANAVEYIDGRWYSLNRAYESYFQDLEPLDELTFHNPHQMDPVAALQLQAMTAGYFREQQPGDAAILVHAGGRISFDGPYLEPAFPFYAMRHGETPANARNIFQGSTDDPKLNYLSPKGLEDARKGAQTLYDQIAPLLRRGKKVLLLTSGLTRTKQSLQPFLDLIAAKIAAGELPEDIRLEVRADPDLNEINFGSLSNTDPADYTAEQAAFEQAYRRGKNATLPAPGGESYLDLIERGLKWLEGMNSRFADGETAVVVFGHGTFLSTLQILTGIKDMADATGYIDWISNRPRNGEVVTFRPDQAILTEAPGRDGVETLTIPRFEGTYAEIGRFFVYYRSALPAALSGGQTASRWADEETVAAARSRGKEVISLADYSRFRNRPVYESVEADEEPVRVWDHTQAAVAALQSVDLKGKTVVELGAGDGILSVVSLRLGARKVVAVDGMNTAGLIEMNMGENEPGFGDYTGRTEFRQAQLSDLPVPGIPKMNWRMLETADVVVMNLPTSLRDSILTGLVDIKSGIDLSLVQTLVLAGSFEDDPAGEWDTAGHRTLLEALGFHLTRKIRVPRDDTFVTAFVLERDPRRKDRLNGPKRTQTLTYNRRHEATETYLNEVMQLEFGRTQQSFTRFVEVGLGGQSAGRWAPTFANWFHRLNKLRGRHPAVPAIHLLGIDQEPNIVDNVSMYYRNRLIRRPRPDVSVDFEVGDFNTLAAKEPGSADVVRVMNVFTHYTKIEEQQEFFGAVTRVLREGGLFLRGDNGLATLWKKQNGVLVPQSFLVEPVYLLKDIGPHDIRQIPAAELYANNPETRQRLETIRTALNNASELASANGRALDLRALFTDEQSSRFHKFVAHFRAQLPEDLESKLTVGTGGLIVVPLTVESDQAMDAEPGSAEHDELIQESRINAASVYSYEDRLDGIDEYLELNVTDNPHALGGHIVVIGFGNKTEQVTAVAERYPAAKVMGIEFDSDNVAEVEAEIKAHVPDHVAQRIRLFEADARDLQALLPDDSVTMVIYPKSLDYFELANSRNGGRNAQALLRKLLDEARRILVPGGIFVATGKPLTVTHAFLSSGGFRDVTIDAYDEEAVMAIKDTDEAMVADGTGLPVNDFALEETIVTLKEQGEDAAQLAGESPGGIDLTGDRLRVEIIRDAKGALLPWEAQPIQHIPIDGMVPVIINIQPVTNLPLLLGAQPKDALPPDSLPRDELGRKDGEDIFDGVKPAVL
ncbi:MAG: histidine phosphatase family protein [Candidatus Omnitrophica bacterium]|nr:histidine phosphatase family protein [Candidatus Omnitrophota bacterium]